MSTIGEVVAGNRKMDARVAVQFSESAMAFCIRKYCQIFLVYSSTRIPSIGSQERKPFSVS
jgi:hypothetical protein